MTIDIDVLLTNIVYGISNMSDHIRVLQAKMVTSETQSWLVIRQGPFGPFNKRHYPCMILAPWNGIKKICSITVFMFT